MHRRAATHIKLTFFFSSSWGAMMSGVLWWERVGSGVGCGGMELFSERDDERECKLEKCPRYT